MTASDRERFEQRARQARLGRRRPLLAGLGALALVLLVVYVVWFSPLLGVRRVVVEGVQGAQAEAVRRVAAVPLGRPLARVDLAGPGRRVTALPAYSEATVSRRWPSEVVVSVTPRTPVLALRREGGFQLVDEDGVGYQPVPAAPKGVPVVSGAGSGAVDARGLRAAATAMDALPERLRASVTDVRVEGPSMVSFTVQRTRVRWGDGSDSEVKVKVLKALLPQRPATVDVSAPDAPATT